MVMTEVEEKFERDFLPRSADEASKANVFTKRLKFDTFYESLSVKKVHLLTHL